MSLRMCKYNADAFCCICGEFVKVRDIKYELNKNVKPTKYTFSILFGFKTSLGLLIMSHKTIVKTFYTVNNF